MGASPSRWRPSLPDPIEDCCRGQTHELAVLELAYLSQNPLDLGILGFKVTLDLERRTKNGVGVLVCRLSPHISGCTEDILADDDDAQQYELQKGLANP